jgi:hypothetical protein
VQTRARAAGWKMSARFRSVLQLDATTRNALALGLFVEVPLLAVAWLAWGATRGGGVPVPGQWQFFDFDIFRIAGSAVFHGRSPYVAPTATLLAANDRFVYPTPFAYLFTPFAGLPPLPAKLLYLLISVLAVGLALALLGVRDRRCYGLALLGTPAFEALGIGTAGPLLLLLVAAGWRSRDRSVSGVFLALAAAAKVFLWPVLVWLLVTRRLRASAAAAATLAVVVATWAAVDLDGLRRYPTTLRVLNEVQRWKSYSVESLALSLGTSTRVAIGLATTIAVVGIAMIALATRGGDGERRALIVAVTVSLLASPILWLHYLVLLLVPICLTRPRLALLWAAPLLLWVTPSTDSTGSSWRIAFVLLVTAGVAVQSLRSRHQPIVRDDADPSLGTGLDSVATVGTGCADPAA